MLGILSFLSTAVLLAACDKVGPYVLAPQLGSHFAKTARTVWVACSILGGILGALHGWFSPSHQQQDSPVAAAEPRSPIAAAHGGRAASHMSAVRTRPPGVKPSLSPASALPASARGSASPMGTSRQLKASRSNIRPDARGKGVSYSLPQVVAALASVWAMLAMPLARIIGRSLDPERCPDGCYGAQLLPLVVLGPLFASITFCLASQVAVRFSHWSLRCILASVVLPIAIALRIRFLMGVPGGILEGGLVMPLGLQKLLGAGLQSQGPGNLVRKLISRPLPSQPVTAILRAASAIMALRAMAPHKQDAIKSYSSLSSQLATASWRLFMLALRLGLLTVVISALVGPKAVNYVPLLQPHDLESHTVLWRGEAASGGFLAVLEGQQGGARYRLLKADHSILGGAYVHPPQYAGQSVYGIFYLQEAVRLVRPGRNALLIGLGIGTAAQGLQEHGIAVDVIELHQEIIELAENFFGYHSTGRQWAADAATVVKRLWQEQHSPANALAQAEELAQQTKGAAGDSQSAVEKYDYILHDVFSGGSMPSDLFTPTFFSHVRDLMSSSGVLAVNYFGREDGNLATVLCAMRSSGFIHIRAFAEHSQSAGQGASPPEVDLDQPRNIVLYASASAVSFRDPTESDTLGNGMRKQTFDTYFKRVSPTVGHIVEVMSEGFDETSRTMATGAGDVDMYAHELRLATIDGQSCAGDTCLTVWNVTAQAQDAAQHWRLMRHAFGSRVWSVM